MWARESDRHRLANASEGTDSPAA